MGNKDRMAKEEAKVRAVREHRAYANKAKFLADKCAHGHEQRPNRKTKIDVWAWE